MDRMAAGLIVLIIAVCGLAIWATHVERKEWEAFAVAHQCEVVAKERGHTQTGIGYGMASSGQFGTVMTTSRTPDKTAYLCNDGITYWR